MKIINLVKSCEICYGVKPDVKEWNIPIRGIQTHFYEVTVQACSECVNNVPQEWVDKQRERFK